MPRLLRLLLHIATVTLVVGMALLGFESAIVGALVLTFTVVVGLFVLGSLTIWMIHSTARGRSQQSLARIPYGDRTPLPATR